MSALAAFLLLPAALLLDRLLGEPPARIHPVCGMGALAAIMERVFRRGPNGPRMTLAGLAACLAVVLPVGLLAALPVRLAGEMLGGAAAWSVCVVVVSLCLAPRCLDEHARRVALPLEQGDLEAARRAVSMLVGRDPQQLDAHGVARACFSFCLGIMDYVRIDTHENNHTMQSAITGYGFRKCGNIYASNGTLRTAYDFIRP